MTDYNQLLERAARLCSSAEKCSGEIFEKLVNWGMEEEDARKAIAYLVEQQFIDDRRFAGYYVRDKLKFNRWGRMKIIYSLRQKKLDEKIIEEAIASIDPGVYNETLEEVLRKKAFSLPDLKNPKHRASLFRFASQRGFTSGEIYEAVDRLAGDL